MKQFDIVRIIRVDENIDSIFWVETPSDEKYREVMKKQCSYIGTVALCTENGGCLVSLHGPLPYNAWWEDADVAILGNLKDGYVADNQLFEDEYNRIQACVQNFIDSKNYFTFNPSELNEYIASKI